MKKQKTLKFFCEKCGKEPKRNEEKSNEKWSVIDNKPCEHCGGKLIIHFISFL